MNINNIQNSAIVKGRINPFEGNANIGEKIPPCSYSQNRHHKHESFSKGRFGKG